METYRWVIKEAIVNIALLGLYLLVLAGVVYVVVTHPWIALSIYAIVIIALFIWMGGLAVLGRIKKS